jgi:hypothetical protein
MSRAPLHRAHANRIEAGQGGGKALDRPAALMSAQQEAIRWRRADGDSLGILAKSWAAIQRVHDHAGQSAEAPDHLLIDIKDGYEEQQRR